MSGQGPLRRSAALPGIKSLEETSPGVWRARYQGNYGVYTIKIVTDGKITKSFSCTCPGSGCPCKHIGMVEKTIAGRLEKSGRTGADSETGAAELLRDVPYKELYDFIRKSGLIPASIGPWSALACFELAPAQKRNVYEDSVLNQTVY